jgi:hypothetical protein
MQLFSGLDYLKIDIANCFGHDKLTWDERIAWYDAQEEFDWESADEPFLAKKALIAMHDARYGKATGHVMYIDATASGLQIMACLMGCKITASQVNLINTGKREDGYGNATTAMNKYTSVEIPRSLMKPPTMTVFYGSKAKPLEVFGEGTPELDAFYRALKDVFPSALEYLEDVQGCWQSDVLYHQWTLPDGCVSKVKVKKEVHGTKIEVDELGSSFTYNATINAPTDTGVSLAANIVQSIDAWIEREMIRRAHKQGFELLCVFDAFGASPKYMNEVRQNYIDILCELADMDLLGSILSEITGLDLSIKKKIDNLSDYIKDSEYPLS